MPKLPSKALKPFMLRVFFFKEYVYANIVNRATKLIAVKAHSREPSLGFAKDVKGRIKDPEACEAVARTLAERARLAGIGEVLWDKHVSKRQYNDKAKTGLMVETFKDAGMPVITLRNLGATYIVEDAVDKSLIGKKATDI